MHLSSVIPLGGGGGDPGQINFVWGFLEGFERLFHPGSGKNVGDLVCNTLAYFV